MKLQSWLIRANAILIVVLLSVGWLNVKMYHEINLLIEDDITKNNLLNWLK